MIRPSPRSARTDTPFPDTTLSRSALGQREVAAVVVAVRCHVRLVAPQAGAGGENRQRHAGTADPQREVEAVDQRRVAGSEAAAQARCGRPLGQRVEYQQVVERPAEGAAAKQEGRLQRAGDRKSVVSGKRGDVRGELGGGRVIKKTK